MGEDVDRYGVDLGERLRDVRRQQGLSLQDVEARSGGALKASVLGAYERGERAVSVARLRALADFYRTPVASLLPDDDRPAPARSGDGALTLDLTALDSGVVDDSSLDTVVSRYAAAVQAQRGDYNGRVLTVRSADLRFLAAVLGRSTEELREELVTSGRAYPS